MIWQNPAIRKLWDRLGFALWLGLIVVVMAISIAAPDYRSVIPTYRASVEDFFAHAPLYDLEAHSGFLYAPAFSVLFAPFALLGSRFGNALWQLASFAALTYAVFAQIRMLTDRNRMWMLSMATFLAIPVAAGAMRNGQATILMAAACWLAIMAAVEGRRYRLLFWISIALMGKPTSVVALLLIGAVYPRQIPVLAIAVAFVVALPFAFAPYDYALENTLMFGKLLMSMSTSLTDKFTPADFTAIFRILDLPLTQTTATFIRATAAIATFGLAVFFRRTFSNGQFALVLTVLTTYYMSVFNPRVEGNTYALLALPFAVTIAAAMRESATRPVSLVLGTVLFSAGLDGLVLPLHRAFEFWFIPTVSTVVFAGVMLVISRGQTVSDDLANASPPEIRSDPPERALSPNQP